MRFMEDKKTSTMSMKVKSTTRERKKRMIRLIRYQIVKSIEISKIRKAKT